MTNRDYVRLWTSAWRRGAQPIRVSASYLYRIHVDGEYLLLRGGRIKHQFQPVGGCYKRYPEATATLTELGVEDAKGVAIEDSERDDLRVLVPAKKLVAFVRWYQARHGREVETWREFYEELVAPGLLPAAAFPFLQVRPVRQRFEGVRWSSHYRKPELLIADVVDVLWSRSQIDALRRRRAAHHPDILWASEAQIRAGGFESGSHGRVQISETSAWTL